MRIFKVVFFLAGICLISGCRTADVNVNNADFFPMSKGTYWIYQGIRTTEDQQTEVSSKLTHRVEVLDSCARDGVTASLLSDFPNADWVWPDKNEQTNYVLLRSSVGRYHLLPGSVWDDLASKIRDPNDELAEISDPGTLVVDAPFSEGKTFGEWSAISRTDLSYCWHVDSVKCSRIKNVRGISSLIRRQVATLVFSTRPDTQTVRFVPGIGVISFEYMHKGSILNMQLELTDFGKNSEHQRDQKHSSPVIWEHKKTNGGRSCRCADNERNPSPS